MTISQRLFQAGGLSTRSTSRPATRGIVSIVVFLAMLAAAGAASATSYYVSTSGSDANPGTLSSPWRHFSHAAATAVAGDTVVFMDGIYDNEPGYYAVTLTNSGTASQPITFMAQHRGLAILDGGHSPSSSTCVEGKTGSYAYINLASTSHIVIQGFAIRNTCDEGIHNNNAASFITIRWNEIYNVAKGIVTSTPYGLDGMYCGPMVHDIILDGNSIHDIGRSPQSTIHANDHGLYISCPNVTIVNNIFYNQKEGWDIQLADAENGNLPGAANVLIANNTFGPIPNLIGEIVIYDTGGSIQGLTIQNNIFYNPTQDAVYGYTPNTSNCQINTNLISGTSGVYYAVQGDGGSGCAIGENLLNIDSDMVDPANHDYALLRRSPAIDAGITLGIVTTDFARTPRPQGKAYDIGAYEYVPCGRRSGDGCDRGR